jgi:hypothetical protein
MSIVVTIVVGLAVWAAPAAAQVWPPAWHGANNLSCQWSHFFHAKDPATWRPQQGRGLGEDTHASYFFWGFPAALPEGTKLLVDGDFPHARSMSFQIAPPWDPKFPSWADGQGAPEIAIVDADIEPDAGHVNPFRPGADRDARSRHYHVTFELRSAPASQWNSLNKGAAVPPYRAPGNLRVGGHRSGKDGQLGPYMFLRIYAPDEFEPYGKVSLPVIRIQRPGEEAVLAPPITVFWREYDDAQFSVAQSRPELNPCLPSGVTKLDQEWGAKREALVAQVLSSLPRAGRRDRNAKLYEADDERELIVYKLFGHARLICLFNQGRRAQRVCPRLEKSRYNRGHDLPPPHNDEHNNGYHQYHTFLISGASVESGEVVLIRGKAPKAPRTVAAARTMGSYDEMRYYSLCLSIGRQKLEVNLVLDCVMDENIAVDQDGNYTIVIGADADRPANARKECGMTWMPWRTALGSLVFRFQSTAESIWTYAPQRVRWADADPLLRTYDPGALRKGMGPYYPDARYSKKAAVEQLGCRG